MYMHRKAYLQLCTLHWHANENMVFLMFIIHAVAHLKMRVSHR